jgi:homopolymeric O-antigen transport system ATP-binding protein
MSVAIRVNDISKQYVLGARDASYDTFRDALTSAVRAPFQRIARRNGKFAPERIWALKDIGFDVKSGEVVGVIGRNGAGKSTLLKVLSRITEPTSGRAELYGRVASLLEVGTGFHPELTGRENIFLNGAILGMKKAEITRKFDEIVAFAELEKFLDTPVKRYSSGMYMRLAFAVASYLESEILIIDEVLAVGDAAFQAKCLGKMREAATTGRTVLFVSHNMAAINQLCSRTIMLADGHLIADGKTSDTVAEYLALGGTGGEWVWRDPKRAPGNDRVRLHAVRIKSGGRVTSELDIDKDFAIEVEFWNYVDGVRNMCANIYLHDRLGVTVLSTAGTPGANTLPEEWFSRRHPKGLYRSVCVIPGNFLNDGLFSISVYVITVGPLTVEVDAPHVLTLNVFDTGAMREPGGGTKWAGMVRVRLPWKTEFLGEESAEKADGAD